MDLESFPEDMTSASLKGQGGVSQVKLLKQRTESTKAGDERARHMQGRLDLKDGGRETC